MSGERTFTPVLPASVVRCLDSACAERLNCLRWLDRHGSRAQAATRNNTGPDGKCRDRIPAIHSNRRYK